ncbi:MAG: class II aldolase/adducin family protein [Opitutae bacterium]|nr:class II aldolase/adducin family protein [Opitutae bacterium]
MTDASTPLGALLDLSHDLGREDRRLAILGEGNTSTAFGADAFLVKASGSNLATLDAAGVTACRRQPLIDLLEKPSASDRDVDTALMDSRLDYVARKPSVEAMFHAWLLSLPGVAFVGHTHPVTVNALLCSARARDFAERRLFPDEIVCCGARSVLVPYTDPGLALARAIRDAVRAAIERDGVTPRVVLLENHGLIALGPTPAAVLAATLMAAKAAEITLGACAAGGPRYLTADDVARIANRSDEHYRQRALGLRADPSP